MRAPIRINAASVDSSRNLDHDDNVAVTTGAASTKTRANTAAAAASLMRVVFSSASGAISRARAAKYSTRMKLSQAPIEVASANPTCASGNISAILQTMLTVVPISAALTGVAVSPRARKGATTLRIRING